MSGGDDTTRSEDYSSDSGKWVGVVEPVCLVPFPSSCIGRCSAFFFSLCFYRMCPHERLSSLLHVDDPLFNHRFTFECPALP